VIGRRKEGRAARRGRCTNAVIEAATDSRKIVASRLLSLSTWRTAALAAPSRPRRASPRRPAGRTAEGSAGRTPRRRPRRARESGRAVAPAGPGCPFYPYHPPRLPMNSRARPGPGANRTTNSNSEVTLARKASKSARGNDASAPLGYEAQLWKMADALRGAMDAAEYKHVVLGLIFLKYISD